MGQLALYGLWNCCLASCGGVGGCSDLLCWLYLRGFCGAAVVCVECGAVGVQCVAQLYGCVYLEVWAVLSGDHLFELNGEPLEFSVHLCSSVVLVGVSGGVGCVLSEEHLCVISGE